VVGENAEDTLRKAVLAFAARIRAAEQAAHTTGRESGAIAPETWSQVW
jgi:XTP/dITP diphosphohydrolase